MSESDGHSLLAKGVESLARAAAQKVSRQAFALNSGDFRQLAVVGESMPELLAKVRKIARSDVPPASQGGRVALVLSGAGDDSSGFATLRLLQAMGRAARGADAPWSGFQRKLQELHGASLNSLGATFGCLYAAAAAFAEDLAVAPALICGHGLAGEAAALTVTGVLLPKEGLALASDSAAQFGGYWPPSVPVASSCTGLFTKGPAVDHFRSVAGGVGEGMGGVWEAVKSCGCDVVVELSLGNPSLQRHQDDQTLTVISTCIGPPADGRIVSGDVAERAILEAAASIFAAGVSVNFAGPLGGGPVSRMPPASFAPKVCWPGDPSMSQWRRQDVCTQAFEAQWLPTAAIKPELRGQHFLVSGGALASKVVAALREHGAVATEGTPSSLTDPHAELVFVLEPAAASSLQSTLHSARAAPHEMLEWLRSFPRRDSGRRAAILSVGAHGSFPDLRSIPAAAMWGAARSARQEMDVSWALRCIDLDPQLLEDVGTPVGSHFASELMRQEARDVLLGRERFVRVLQSLHLPLLHSPETPTFPKVFGITGGTGALGLIVAEWISTGSSQLILASRSGKVPEENKQLWTNLCRTSAQVTLCNCDVGSDPSPLTEKLAGAEEPFGVAHLAGILRDGLFLRQDKSSLDLTMKPKVDGAALLVESLRSQSAAVRMQHLWLFSSVTSCLGNLGQTAYGASNSALDAMGKSWFLGSAAGPEAGASLAVQWGPWAEFGMAADLPKGSTSIFKPWQQHNALRALEAVLTLSSPIRSPVVCLTQFDWGQMFSDLGQSMYYQGFLREFLKQPSEPKSQAAPASSVDVQTVVLDTLSRFLPNGKDGVTEDAEFDELGLDSLSGVEASRALAAALAPLGIEGIKPTFLFEASSLRVVMSKLPAPKPAARQVLTSMPSQPNAEVARASESDVRQTVIDTLSRFLPNGKDGVTEDVEFDELGLDSLSGVEASRALAAALAPLGIEGIKPTFLFEASSLRVVMSKLPAPKPAARQVLTSMPSQPNAEVARASESDVRQTVIDTLSRFLPNGKDGVTEDVEFDELGLDSLSGVEASRALAAALAPLGIEGIKPTFLFESNSLRVVLGKNLVLNRSKSQRSAVQCSGVLPQLSTM